MWPIIFIGAGLAYLLHHQSQHPAPIRTGRGSSFQPGTGPRGLRNNNPGNIRISQNSWRGKIPLSQNSDGAFEQFESMAFGIRAMIVLLRTYYHRHGLTTIREIISRWAPPGDNNDTDAYIAAVSRMSGYPPDKPLFWNRETVLRLVQPMIIVENGGGGIAESDFDQGWRLV